MSDKCGYRIGRILVLVFSYLLVAVARAQNVKLVIPDGHSGSVTSAIYSHDGSLILTAATDGTARIWDAKTGLELKRFGVPKDSLGTAKFSLDGNEVIAAGTREIRIWDIKRGKLLRTLRGHHDAINDLSLSSSGKYLASASQDTSILVWRSESNKPFRREDLDGWKVSSVMFSPNGSKMLETFPWTVRIVDAQTGKVSHRIKVEAENFTAAYSPDGGRIAVSGRNRVTMYSADLNQAIREFGPTNDYIDGPTHVAFSRDSKLVAAASFNGTVKVWQCDIGSLVQTLLDVPNDVTGIQFSPDGHSLLLSYWKGAGIWDIKTGRRTVQFGGGVFFMSNALFMDHGRQLAILSIDNNVRIVDSSTARVAYRIKSPVQILAECVSGSQIAVGCSDGQAAVFDSKVGRRESVVRAGGAVSCICFSADGKRLITGSDDRLVRIWDVKTGGQILSFHSDPIYAAKSIAASPDFKHLAILTGDEIEVSDLANGNIVTRYDGLDDNSHFQGASIFGSIAYSRDGSKLLVATDGPWLGVLKASPLKLIKVLKKEPYKDWNDWQKESWPDGVTSAVFSSDGKRILSASQDNTVKMWTLDGSPPKVLHGHENWVMSAEFSPDDSLIASTSGDRTLRIWKGKTYEEQVKVVLANNGSFLTLGPKYRFDCSDIESLNGLHWIVSDDPFTPLPLDIFMRQYYEPNLYARAMKGEKLSDIPSIARLNRVQPKVDIILPDKQTFSDSVTVTIRVSAASREYGEPKILHTTGAKDLRIFRDRRMVLFVPGPLVKYGDAPYERQFTILIPKEGKKSVEISAYALNDDGIKSNTPTVDVSVTESLVKPKAFILSVGVNACEDESLALSYAKSDAETFANRMSDVLKSSGDYEDVEPTILTSSEGSLDATTKTVKQAIEDIVQRARPEDLVLISWSGHGFIAKDHKLHLILSDTGNHLDPESDNLPGTVSSDELSDWLEKLDARSAFVLDACHSMASVSAGGFKPGPMGDRGLGQLSYDKGMMILAASQDSGVAVETRVKGVGRGLLTYALIDRGLSSSPKSLRAWMTSAADSVPTLYKELEEGKLKGRSFPAVKEGLKRSHDPYIQTPQLFDFAKNWDAQLHPNPPKEFAKPSG